MTDKILTDAQRRHGILTPSELREARKLLLSLLAHKAPAKHEAARRRLQRWQRELRNG